MDEILAIGLLGRLFVYSVLFYWIDSWAWEEQRRATLGRAVGYALVRMIVGGLLGWFIIRQFAETGEGIQSQRAVFLVLSRFVLWGWLFAMIGARSFRLASGVAVGMLANLFADVVFPWPVVLGLPFYC